MTTEQRGRTRYCPSCGQRLDATDAFCPRCGVRWRATQADDSVQTLVGLLGAAEDWRDAGLLDAANAERVRAHLEARLDARSPDATRAPARAVVPTELTMAPAAPPGPSWTSQHQADLLLYAGAFLLVIAALIFVSYQGEALPAVVRVLLLAVYTGGFITAGFAVRGHPSVREAGRVFLALGALVSPLNFVLVYVELLEERGVSGDLVWLLGSLYALVFYWALGRGGHGRLYAILARVAVVSAWAALAAVLNVPEAWGAAWFMAPTAAAAGTLAMLGHLTNRVAIALAVAAALLLFVSAVTATAGEGHEVQLPVTCLLLTAGLAVAGYGRREPFALPVTATAALATVLATLWVAGVDAEWNAYAWLALAVATVTSRGRWTHWSDPLARFGWVYAAAAALGAMTPFPAGVPNWHAVLAAAGAASVLALVAWRDERLGVFSDPPGDPATPFGERVAFAWAAAAMLLAAVAHAQLRLEVAPPDTGWVYLGLAVLTMLALAVLVPRSARWEWVFLGPALAAVFASLQRVDRFPGHDAAILGVAGAVLASVALLRRRWASALLAAALLGTALAAAWYARDWPWWTLAVTYTALGVPLFAALSPHRRYVARTAGEELPILAAQLLSWAGPVTGPVVAAVALQLRIDEGVPAGVDTTEYRVLTLLILALAPFVAFEGWRFRQPLAYVAASAVVTLAGLMAIAILQPGNVQAYTVPLGVYLIVLGVLLRRVRSSAGAPAHLYPHEVFELLGAAVIVLPQAEQSFAPGGAYWGFVLMGEGALFLVLAFVLSVRWLAVAGVLTLSGVALRWLAESGDTIPYWITLGLVGLLLLGLGFLLLARQDWWTGIRDRTTRWWNEAPGRP